MAVGDSEADAALAPFVGAVFIANGRRAVHENAEAENVFLTQGAYGDGFAEAVLGVLEPAV